MIKTTTCGKMFLGTDDTKHFCDRSHQDHLKPEMNLHYCKTCDVSEKPKPVEQPASVKQA